MSQLTADLFVSIDGCASADDVGPYFGYGGPELEAWIDAELDRPQVIVLGRVTYEALATISADGAGPGSRLTAAPKMVVSSTLAEPLRWANTRLIVGDAVDALPALKRDSDLPMRVMGSISMVHSLAGAGLVDRLRLMVFPLTCGSAGGDRIFQQGELERWELQQTTVLDRRLVLLEYSKLG